MALAVQVVIDCADPASLAAFWAGALGYTVQPPPPGFATWDAFLTQMGIPESQWNSRSAVVDPDAAGPRIFLQRVPESKTVKNRVHLDIRASGSPQTEGPERRARIDAKTDELIARGATRLHDKDEMGEYWVVMHDPEGNEFCVT